MKMLLFLVALFITWDIIYSQSDTMYIETGGNTIAYPLSSIAQLTFDGLTGLDPEDINKMNAILNSFTLHQNYPNPFNPTTKIAYHLPSPGKVFIGIYDINGTLVREILSSTQEAGEHTVFWDSRTGEGTNASSGVYFYQVRFNNSILTKKMILIK
ncbi:MAG: T9SS type A sorting domain-containing protein [Ignavibacteriaceae bacterium]|nr:T9SS type A sorting domain-containing protein [Ignavibacteriaceae bacterium]